MNNNNNNNNTQSTHGRHEGRSWYSDFRGLLWIASTSKTPEHADVINLQANYNLSFPGDVARIFCFWVLFVVGDLFYFFCVYFL